MAALIEKQLGQVTPTDTNPLELYNPGSGVKARVVSIIVCNTSAGSVDFRIFHDANGTTYNTTTALHYDTALAANSTLAIEVNIADNNEGSLAVRTSSANDLTFTAYGYER